jgi:site-specific DNA-adenine methylase
MNTLKTPLRYPGGKSRACPKMDPYFPELLNYDEFREPFLGGGSVAIHITKKYPNLDVWVNDLYEPLVNFWQQLQMFGVELSDELLSIKNTCGHRPKDKSDPDLEKDERYARAKQVFETSQSKIHDFQVPSFDRAVAFYIVNKCSFSGLTASSCFSSQASDSNWNESGISKLPEYAKIISNWRITNYSYDYMMDGDKGAFMYLDPPYDIKDNLYGHKGSMHKGFDHDKFAADCDFNNMDQLISYNSDQLVKDRFKGWNAAEFDLTYTMRSVGDYMKDQKTRKELLLFNYDLRTKGLVKLDQFFEGELD